MKRVVTGSNVNRAKLSNVRDIDRFAERVADHREINPAIWYEAALQSYVKLVTFQASIVLKCRTT